MGYSKDISAVSIDIAVLSLANKHALVRAYSSACWTLASGRMPGSMISLRDTMVYPVW